MNVATPQRFAKLYKLLLPKLPVFIALVFGLYSFVMFSHTYVTWLRMKQEADAFVLTDSQRRAAGVGDLMTVIRGEAERYANLYEIRAYLANRDLGMSPQYGLNASLAEIDIRFAELQNLSAGRMLQRIVFVDQTGEVLADTRPAEPLPQLFRTPVDQIRVEIDPLSANIIVAAPVRRGTSLEGFVGTVTTSAFLYRNLIAADTGTAYEEFLLSATGRELPGGKPRAITQQHLKFFASAKENQILDLDHDGDATGMLAVKTPVPDLPLHLVTMLASDRIHGHLVSKAALVTAGVIPILLLFLALYLNRARLAAEKFEHDMLISEQQRLGAIQRSQDLAEEVRRREQVEKALLASEQRWALAVGGTNDGIWDWDLATGALYLSDRWKSMIGYLPGDFEGRLDEWQALLHPDDIERVMREVAKHFAGETDFYETDFRLRCKDGSYKWIKARGKALFGDDGKPVRMSGSHTDISERRAAENRARDRTEQLNTIFELSPDGIVSLDAVGRVKYASPAFLGMTGFIEPEINGLDEAAFIRCLIALCANGEGVSDINPMSAANIAKLQSDIDQKNSGEQHYRIELVRPARKILDIGVRHSLAETVSKIFYVRDITQQTEIDDLKSEFLSTAAHELRTPMTSILGFNELLRHGDFDEQQRREFQDTIHRNSSLMSSIIDELLDLARIEARRGKDFKFEPLELCNFLPSVVAAYKPPDSREGPVLQDCDVSCQIKADRNKITEAVNNVLSNAYKYSPGGGEVALVVIARPGQDGTPGEVGVIVTDHGIGMNSEQLARVCERFYRADTSGNIPGTGLGMSIVKEIVELHGGRLSITSTPGSGSQVGLWFPAFRANPV